jgi:hypothetical protein
MQQDILIPEKTVKHLIEDIRLTITDPAKVTAQMHVVQIDEVTQQRKISSNVTVAVNELLAAETTLGNLTSANVTGFKKCIKAICAKALAIDFVTTNDAL